MIPSREKTCMPANRRQLTTCIVWTALILAWNAALQSCQTVGVAAKVKTTETVQIPFMKNSANECYYLDDFMPLPDTMVTGRYGALRLRYYTFKAANYKKWSNNQVVLSFYSMDDSCWSLFEEYYIID